MKKIFLSLVLISSSIAFAQKNEEAKNLQNTKAPENWFNLDPEKDHVNGVGADRTYLELLNGKKSKTVIVGVIDSGVDYNHEDLKDVMWTNEKEIPGNGIDDDKNGYIDDIHGWNFIGGKDGKNIEKETLELTRLYKELSAKYENKSKKEISNKKEYKEYLKIKEDYENTNKEAQQQLLQIGFIKKMIDDLVNDVKDQLKIEKITLADLSKYKPKDKKEEQLIGNVKGALQKDNSSIEDLLKELNTGYEQIEDRVKYNLNINFDPRNLVGDDYKNADEKYYGNNDCIGPNSLHGTHVAGIIAANRFNNLGIKGVADNVRIMAIRAVPNGDERDKDIANAIYYAVNNGAEIINMSFGKSYSYNKEAVDKAVKYAASKNVLIIHAAGNDSKNIDKENNFPSRKFAHSCKRASNWMEIGALNWKQANELVAPFSNFGKKSVDVFAPGVDIYSTKNDGGYLNESGTSMACPVAVGVAAVIKSYFPSLSANEIKEILIKSSYTNYKSYKVFLPQGAGKMETKKEIKFKSLSKTGGIINLYHAVELAMKKYNT